MSPPVRGRAQKRSAAGGPGAAWQIIANRRPFGAECETQRVKQRGAADQARLQRGSGPQSINRLDGRIDLVDGDPLMEGPSRLGLEAAVEI